MRASKNADDDDFALSIYDIDDLMKYEVEIEQSTFKAKHPYRETLDSDRITKVYGDRPEDDTI